MALSFLVWAIILLPVYLFVKNANGLRVNIAKAKTMGIPYYVLPAAIFNRLWLATAEAIWIPIAKRLPIPWVQDRLDLMRPDLFWRGKFDPYERRNTDVFAVVSPGRISVEVANAPLVKQFVTRKNDFLKDEASYALLNIYGRNVVSTEGAVWRAHRKITAPPFSEKNNAVVWSESAFQTAEMLRSWTGPTGAGNIKIDNLEEDTMRLPLHVIARAGLGVRLQWPGSDTPMDTIMAKSTMAGVVGSDSSAVPNGHTLSFRDALGILLHNILLVLIFPAWFLKYSPFKKLRHTYLAYEEWGQYQREMFQQKIQDVRSDVSGASSDLLGALVKGAGYDETVAPNFKAAEAGVSHGPRLTDEEIMGNAFVFIIAGHETTANTLQYSLINLAMSYHAQDAIHKDLDMLLPKGQAPGEWSYESLYKPLAESYLGAVMNEVLRLWAPVVAIPRVTHNNQTVTYNKKQVIIPKGSHITYNVPALHRHPGYWPTSPLDEPERDNLDAFIPDRWYWRLEGDEEKEAQALDETKDTSEDHLDTANTTHFRPAPGVYIPFNDGARACLGRRFAAVEFMAILAVLLQHYSVELDIESFLEVANGDEKVAWGLAKTKAQWMMNEGSSSVITLQIREGRVPVRMVPRGKERFRKYASS